MENYQQVIKFHLEQSSFNFEDNENLQHLLNAEDLFETALSNIVTDHQLTQYCQHSLGLIEPVQVHLGTDENNKLESFQYIPILKVLQLILSNEDILNSVNSNLLQRESDSEILADYTDGTIYKKHSFVSKGHNHLRIHLYTDEFEVVNPLGSKKTLHKLCAFYFLLGNIGETFLPVLIRFLFQSATDV